MQDKTTSYLDYIIYIVGSLSLVLADVITYIDHHVGAFTVIFMSATFFCNEWRKNRPVKQEKR